MNRFIITDPSSCIGCRTCEVACTLAHQDPGEFVVKQESFMPRLAVVVNNKTTTTVQCRHCEDAPCVNVCPTNALIYHNRSVQFLEDNCIGCKTCVIACPYGAMTMSVNRNKIIVTNGLHVKSMQATALKCDLCPTRNNGPACIEACPTKAIHLVTENSMTVMNREKQQLAVSAQAAGVIR